MHAPLRAPDGREMAVLGGGLLGAVGFGLVAGRSPVVAIAAVLATAVAVPMLSDLTLACVIFTVFSFADMLHLGGSATGAKALGALLVLAWIARLAGQPAGERRSFLTDHRTLALLAMAVVAWSLLTLTWAQNHSTALLGASRYAQDLLLLPIVYSAVTRVKEVRWVATAYAVGALLAMLYGVAAHRAVDGSRLIGAVGDPNESAAVLVAGAVLFLALAAGSERGSTRRRVASVAAVVSLVGMAATASRGGIIALTATAVAAVLLGGRWRRQIAAASAVGGVVVIGWFVLLAPTNSVSHITSTATPRTTLWTVAGRMIASNPVVGVGTDNFAVAAKDYLIKPGATTRADQVVSTPEPAHNTYLELWADTGIIGLALFVGLVTVSLRAAWGAVGLLVSAGRRADEILARALIVASLAMLAAGFFISDQYSKRIFILLALAPALLKATRTELSQRVIRTDALAHR